MTTQSIEPPPITVRPDILSAGHARDTLEGSERLSSVLVKDLMTSNLVTVGVNQSIRSVAQLMYQYRISCLPVATQGQLVGLVTEADFVSRVVAHGRNADDPVSSMMTPSPVFVHPDHSVLDVLTLMTRHRISHMPVVEEPSRQLVGIVTQTDVVRHQIASSVFLVGDIARMQSSSAIASIVKQLPRLLCTLVDNGSSAYETGRVMTSITGAVTRRLLELAEQKFGKAPVPFVWLACGSQGRQEQTGATDQDNCLLLDDAYDENVHASYFHNLAHFVCGGLDEAGYVFCPGDMMASNEKWCQPLRVWREYFKQWINKPGTESQMLASVMFDLRAIHGKSQLYQTLRDEALKMAQGNSIFVAHMSSNCLTHRPPLGWFGRFRTQRSGVHVGKVDLKHEGVVPIVDLARVYALSAGITAVNTLDRLKSGAESSVLSPSGASSLLYAYETISIIRLQHQARQIRQGRAPDNFLDPAQLENTQKERLRNAMKDIKSIQSALSNRVAVVGR